MSRYLLNGAYSKASPDDNIERCAGNALNLGTGFCGHPLNQPQPALLKAASPQYCARVQKALAEFRCNATWNEVKQRHGVVVTREAANLFILESRKRDHS